ncbi:MAG: DUF502 domain-containing protein [Puniceicoccales bacterium]|nr:DUF502 domain-containing protein [Puniceicoccales bacterium]
METTAKPAKGLVLSVWPRLASDAGVGPFWVEKSVMVISAFVVVLAITAIGMFSRYFFGRLLITTLESVIERLPVIKSVYSSIKQIVATFGAQNKANFKQVVLVQFPHKDVWTVAFVTNRSASELSEKLGYPVVHVFVPTTPNPTGGYFLLFRETEIIPLKMAVGEGMKLIVSGGAVLPVAPAEVADDEEEN